MDDTFQNLYGFFSDLSQESNNVNDIQINDTQQALSLKTHLEFMSEKISMLEDEYTIVISDSVQLDNEIKSLRNKITGHIIDNSTKKQDLQLRYLRVKDELDKQISLSNEILTKKVEEHNCIIKYLKTVSFDVSFPDELSKFNSLCPSMFTRVGDVTKKNKMLEAKQDDAMKLRQVNILCKNRLKTLRTLATDINNLRNNLDADLKTFADLHKEWSEKEVEINNMCAKVVKTTDQLNTLIIECAGSENISDTMTKYVRNKCVEFVASSSEADLLDGLTKYKKRLDKIVQEMRRDEQILAKQVNQLTVIKDQTADQTKYYSDIIQNSTKSLKQ